MRPVRRLLGLVVALAALGNLATSAGGDEDLQALRKALEPSSSPAERKAQIPRLVAHNTLRAVETLALIVRTDADASVRAAAADGLGRMALPRALDLLLELTAEGGPQVVRGALAGALARQPLGAQRVLERVAAEKTTEPERVLLVEALAGFRDPVTRAALFGLSRDLGSAVRSMAWRTLAARKDEPEQRAALMVQLLHAARDTDAIVEALDAFEPCAHASMRSAAERHATSLEPVVHEAAEAFLARLRAAEEAMPPPSGAPATRPDDRYGPPTPEGETVPRPGSRAPRARYDLVYVFDATGSTAATLPVLKRRILDEYALLTRLGASVKVGCLAYRNVHATIENAQSVERLLPTFDRARIEAFLQKIAARGVDDRGASIAPALHESLNRMPWRWDARREVQLFADTGCDDARAAAAVVGLHFRSDRTRTRVAYVLRTRTQVPEELYELARLGGTGLPELIP